METQGADTIVGSALQTLPRSNLQHPGPTVLIVSDLRLLRDGLVLSLSQQPSLAVADSADLTISPTYIAAARPDVVLLDVGAPGGLETLFVVRQALPDLRIVAIAVSDIEQMVVACAEAGVSGFVSRDGSIQDLVTAIHCAMRNELACSPRIAGMLFRRVAPISSERSHGPDNSALTRREHEIVSLMTQGLSNKEMRASCASRTQRSRIIFTASSPSCMCGAAARSPHACTGALCCAAAFRLRSMVTCLGLSTTRSPGWTRSKALELPISVPLELRQRAREMRRRTGSVRRRAE